MKIRKRYILLIILSILPFYKIIHFGDYCINDVDYLIITFLSIIVLVTFIASLFYNLYQISIHRELFNYRPFFIFGIFSIALYIGIKNPDILLFKSVNQQFQYQIDATSQAKILLFKDNTFLYKTKYTNETCTKHGTYYFKNDSLFLKLNSGLNNQKFLNRVYFFDKNENKLIPESIDLPTFQLN